MIFTKILVRMSSFKEAIPHILLPKAKYLSAFSLGCSLMILGLATSCSATRHVQMQVAEHIQKDTVYLSNIQYDSIYIYNNVYQDRSRDTVLIRETNTEYRYKLLRDTIYKVRVDSIPYEVRITKVKEVPRPRNLFDCVSYICFGILLYYLSIKITRFIHA